MESKVDKGHLVFLRCIDHKPLDIFLVVLGVRLVIMRAVRVKGEPNMLFLRRCNSDLLVAGEDDPLKVTASLVYRLPIVANCKTLFGCISNHGPVLVIKGDVKVQPTDTVLSSLRCKQYITAVGITPKRNATFQFSILVKTQMDAVDVFEFVVEILVKRITRRRLTARTVVER